MEVCVDCVESAVNAEKGGAMRIELCSALSEGGLTPTAGLLKAVKDVVKIPVFCMLRPRRGPDFLFSRSEIEAIKTDVMLLRVVGNADGFVFGALTKDGRIDVDVCREILQITAPLPVTFHRAIDVCVDPITAVNTIAELGFKRILTSGQEVSAEKGITVIKEMVKRAGKKISIMVGAGISKDNIAHILQQTGAQEYHGSARSPKAAVDGPKINASMGPADVSELMVTCSALVAETVSAASKFL